MKLMIVESPNKIKKLKSYLDNSWEVSASVGHIRDLPQKGIGVEPPTFKPHYVVAQGKSKVIAKLKKLASEATEVYLATDLDREGEAIAWHLKDALRLKSPKRISFNQITKSALNNAINNPTVIDENLVAAQEGRRVLDRIVGYTVSPVLSNQSGIPLSGGRVQSPAIKLVVIRENEVRSFVKKEHYSVSMTFGNGLVAQLEIKDWSDAKYLFDRSLAEKIASYKEVNITEVETADSVVNPRAPFTTSTLQQAASSVLKISPGDAMKAAQGLFEKGAITYHRTDSKNLSAEGFTHITEYLVEKGFPVQQTQITWASKALAQEAHEAIRPTDIAAENIGDTSAEKRLYDLIRERTLCSTMPPAVDIATAIKMETTEEISTEKEGRAGKARYIAKGKVEKTPGWRALSKIEAPKKGQSLPAVLEEGETISGETKVEQKTTEPPSRFTEATLIKALEKLDIGRPSTYASIMENIKKRSYIVIGEKSNKKDDKIRPTETGEQVVKALSGMTFMNLDYTSTLEKYLDKIAKGQGSYLQLVESVYETTVNESKGITMESLIKTVPCPGCGEPIVRKYSKTKEFYFWVHHNDDHDCESFIKDKDGSPLIAEPSN